MRVLDVLGSLTKKTSLNAQIRHLPTLNNVDNVHLTKDSYIAIADGIVEACKKLATTQDTVSAVPAKELEASRPMK
jgi:lysophospholipase L1-like esterase